MLHRHIAFNYTLDHTQVNGKTTRFDSNSANSSISTLLITCTLIASFFIFISSLTQYSQQLQFLTFLGALYFSLIDFHKSTLLMSLWGFFIAKLYIKGRYSKGYSQLLSPQFFLISKQNSLLSTLILVNFFIKDQR